jgi:hypothetical protein
MNTHRGDVWSTSAVADSLVHTQTILLNYTNS